MILFSELTSPSSPDFIFINISPFFVIKFFPYGKGLGSHIIFFSIVSYDFNFNLLLSIFNSLGNLSNSICCVNIDLFVILKFIYGLW
jgi:hypothetical protein